LKCSKDFQAQPFTPQNNIATFPAEILALIFANLDPCSSACMAVTLKRLYEVHMYHTGIVDLISHMDFGIICTISGPCEYQGPVRAKSSLQKSLFGLLKQWAGKDRLYCGQRNRFVQRSKGDSKFSYFKEYLEYKLGRLDKLKESATRARDKFGFKDTARVTTQVPTRQHQSWDSVCSPYICALAL